MKSFKVTDFNAPLTEVDQPTPQPSGTQVLIKVKAAGVCHSDLHIWEGGYELGHGRKPLSLKERGVTLPRTMGHETVGEIAAFGPDVTAADKGAEEAIRKIIDAERPDDAILGEEYGHKPGTSGLTRPRLARPCCRSC